MITVYKLTDNKGNIYVGSTSRSLNIRLNEHKCHKSYSVFDYNSCIIKKLETCSKINRYKVENFWIKKLKSINKAEASLGPIGYKNSAKEIKRKSIQMTLMHKNNKEAILRGRNKSLTSEKQKQRSKISHEKRWAKMPQWFAIEKISGKKYGPFKGYFVAKNELLLHETTLIRALLHGTNNRRFSFMVGG